LLLLKPSRRDLFTIMSNLNNLPPYTLGNLSSNITLHVIVAHRTLCGARIHHPRDLILYQGDLQLPTCKRCLSIIEKRESAVPSDVLSLERVPPQRIPNGHKTPLQEPMPPELRWNEALDKLFRAMRSQTDHLGQNGSDPALTLEFTLLPLLRRYMLGDRSPQLYRDMLYAPFVASPP
jgi:hypothetical protein